MPQRAYQTISFQKQDWDIVAHWEQTEFDECEDSSMLWVSGEVVFGLITTAVIGLGAGLYHVFVQQLGFAEYMAVGAAMFWGYILMAYAYNPVCFPSVPAMLLQDIATWLDENLQIRCLCAYIPFLHTGTCDLANCATCTSLFKYNSCYDVDDSFKKLSIFWAPAFLVRWLLPDFVAWLYKLRIWPISNMLAIDGVDLLVAETLADDPIRGVQYDCFKLHFVDIGVVAAGGLFIAVVIAPLFSNVCRAVYAFIIAFIYSCLGSYQLARSI